MYKYRVSKTFPWWTKNNQNVPSRKILTSWLENNMKNIDNITINFSDINSLKLNSKYDDIKYIEQYNLETNEKRYYYVNNIEKIAGNNSFIYNCLIDIYSSFTINFIYDNFEKDLIFIRTHDYDDQCLEINDDNIISIPKFYENFYFQKKLFNYDEKTKIWYGEKIGISGDDLLNGNKYYVFKDGDNGGYKFFPILSKDKQINIHYEQQVRGELLYEKDFYNGKYNNDLKIEIDDNLNSEITKAYNNNNIVEYYYQKVSYGFRLPAHTVWLDGWIKINTNYGIYPISINAYNTSGYSAGLGLKYIDYNIFLSGNNIYHVNHTNITASKFGDIDHVGKNGRKFKVKIFKNNPTYKSELIDNSFSRLEIYRKREENINKFLGIYYLPHFLNFKKFNKDGNYVFITINPSGDNIDFFNIFDYSMSNINDKLNNTSYSNPYLLKFLQIKYYGNLINAEFRTNKEHKIYIGGKIFFTDTCNIISKSSDLLDLSKSIITYPYQLPFGVDTYENYVKANRSSTETSFNIFKQQENMKFASTIFNGTTKFIGNGIDAISSFARGDISDGLSDTFSSAKTILNTSNSIINQIQSGKHQVMKIRQQYNQANLTMGNNIQFSNIDNASLIHYYDGDNEQFEGVEISDLNENSLAMINNYILLNGYFLPKKDNFKNRIENNRSFNFIQIDSQLLSEQLNILNNYINEIYNLIFEQLTNGVRIWNIENINDIPNYDNNDKWPNQPDEIIPPVNPPLPPIKPEPSINISLESNDVGYINLGFKQIYCLFSIGLIESNITCGYDYDFNLEEPKILETKYNNEKIININLNIKKYDKLNVLIDFASLLNDLTININCNVNLQEIKKLTNVIFTYIVESNKEIYVEFGNYNEKFPITINYNGEKIYGK